MPKTVRFAGGGVDLEGLLFLPDGPGPHPTVVMAGGWCYVKELVQPRFAEVFRRAGIASLIFDYRGFGGSEGEPRQHLEYSVEPHVRRLVETPTLMVLADSDDFTWSDLEVRAFNQIPTPAKKLHVMTGSDHHRLYRDPERSVLAANVCRDWYGEHL